jgi:hypothetical protein
MSCPISASRLLRTNLSALFFRRPEPLELYETILLTAIHAAGLVALAVFFHISWVVVVPGLFLLFLLQPRVQLSPLLAPFLLAYGVLLIRFVFVRFLKGTIGDYYDYLLPDWGLALFHVQAATLAAGIYSMLFCGALVLRSRRREAVAAALILAVGTVIWAGVEYSSHRTAGATGSDPYDYAQMGVDLAANGTVVHRFPLFPIFATLKLSWFPLLHVGYHLPMNEQGDAATVFPAGGALAFALAYRVFGEEGLYLVNPLFTLLSALAAGLLGWELTRDHDMALRALVASLTCILVATANEQVAWAGVTMVDAQAEFFSVLSVLLALRTRRDKSASLLLMSGGALAAAYWVRHTQIVLVASLLIIFLEGNVNFHDRARALFLSGGAALVIAAGDLWYHQTYLGGWLHPESEELALFSASAIPSSAGSLLQQAFAANEFGWLFPFLILGAVFYVRGHRTEFAAIAAWLGLSLALHLPYAALRLRDLLPEFPVVAFFTAFGLCFAVGKVMTGRRWQWAAGLLMFASLEVLLLRVWNTAPRVWEAPRPTFGYMTQSQRASFARLATITSQSALIGSTLNDGAIELYSGRSTFRPDAWSGGELREFLSVVATSHPDVYLLDDGSAMESVLEDLRDDFVIKRVATLDVPLFGNGPDSEPGSLWKVELK